MRPNTAIARALGLVTLAGFSLSACGGEAGGAPDDAAESKFCAAYNDITTDVFGNVDDNATEEDQAKSSVKALQKWADKMIDVGTPEDMPDEAREGFEVTINTIKDLDDETDVSDLQNLEADYSDDDKAGANAFNDFVTKSCNIGMAEMPSDLPTP